MSNHPAAICSRQSLRLPEYDYSQQGAYFLTLCTRHKACLFGQIRDGIMQPSRIGHLVCDEWLLSSTIRQEMAFPDFVLMPNHLHGIVLLQNMLPRQASTRQNGPRAHSIGAFVAGFKAAVTRRLKQELALTTGIWQRNFHEHVIRNEADYQRLAEYIANNPLCWEMDSLAPPTLSGQS